MIWKRRWLLAPVYVGLVLSLVMLLIAFVGEIVEAFPHVIGMKTEEVILTVLSLIDLSLALNLVMIVIFSGYENFVSKIDTGGSEDRPEKLMRDLAMAGVPLTAQVGRGDFAQMWIDERHKVFKCLGFAFPPLDQEHGDFALLRLHAGPDAP